MYYTVITINEHFCGKIVSTRTNQINLSELDYLSISRVILHGLNLIKYPIALQLCQIYSWHLLLHLKTTTKGKLKGNKFSLMTLCLKKSSFKWKEEYWCFYVWLKTREMFHLHVSKENISQTDQRVIKSNLPTHLFKFHLLKNHSSRTS